MTDWLPGDLAVVHIGKVAGRVIEGLQALSGGRCDYEHAIIGVGNGLIVEAQPGGAILTAMHYPDDAVCWSTGRLQPRLAQLVEAKRSELVYAAHSLIGTPYSYLDYGAIAAHTWHLPVPGLREYVADTGHMICSQLVDECYRRAGIELFTDDRWTGYVRPYDLAVLMHAHSPGMDG